MDARASEGGRQRERLIVSLCGNALYRGPFQALGDHYGLSPCGIYVFGLSHFRFSVHFM